MLKILVINLEYVMKFLYLILHITYHLDDLIFKWKIHKYKEKYTILLSKKRFFSLYNTVFIYLPMHKPIYYLFYTHIYD